jgi:AcrR family transcriptional regulator
MADAETAAAAGRPASQARRLKKESLLRNAARALNQRGLRQTTMDDIALAAGTSKVVLYRYFASKEDLIHSILERISARLLTNERQPFHGIGTGFVEALRIAREDHDSFMLMMKHSATDPEFGSYVAELRGAIVDENLKRFADDAVLAGYNELFNQMCAEAIATFCLDALVRWAERGDPAQDEDFTSWAIESLKGLYRGWRKDVAAHGHGTS